MLGIYKFLSSIYLLRKLYFDFFQPVKPKKSLCSFFKTLFECNYIVLLIIYLKVIYFEVN